MERIQNVLICSTIAIISDHDQALESRELFITKKQNQIKLSNMWTIFNFKNVKGIRGDRMVREMNKKFKLAWRVAEKNISNS
jgi:hypothetical protein